MPTPDPEPTLDLAAGTSIDHARVRYDAAWYHALVSGGPRPDRAEFLGGIADGRDSLVAALDAIDGAYERFGVLVRTGQVSLSPAGHVPNPVPSNTPSQYAETLDPIAGRAPTRESAAVSASAETLDSAPDGGTRPATTRLAAGAAVGGYEILGEIAHGGMGVVYKARHTRLDRPAAIKMILAGAHAAPEHFARFQAEAQVVARLQHPNIVQLFEVGEHDDLPYIALEFVDGGSLAGKAGGRPQPLLEAAATVEVLARAMDYAHSQGVVHRDLKPANVLLTAGGVPKVTDFGLAKRLEGDSSQTRSGTLMGTPAYMAPEQAAGHVHAIGPQTDVYALGAVLYELLTGVPPFGGATPLETVVAVLKNDPVPPGRLRPDVPRDLETICLKCLEKEAPKRYASAAELADDLRRFLAGETIRARPVGRAERVWRWCRRNPGIAGLSAAVFLLLTTVAAGATAAAVRIRAEKHAAEDNAEAARAAQGRAEGALAETERQKGIAERNETAARAARDQAETARNATEAALKKEAAAKAAAEKARVRADDLATEASAQRELALDALGGLVTKVQTHLDDAPGVQQLRKDLLELAIRGLKKIGASGEDGGLVDVRMAEGHRRLGDLAQRLGDLALARQSYERVDRIVRQQAEANPGDPNWKRSVSVAAAKLGDLCAVTGDRPGARRYYEDARKLREGLLLAGGTPAKIDLAQVYVKLGDVSEPAGAVELFKEALALREEILKTNPRDPDAARDVRVSHFKLADVYLKTGDPAAARPHALKGVALADALTKALPKSVQLKQDVAMSRAKLGDVYRAEQKPAEALKQYEAAVRAIEPLADANPKDLLVQVARGLLLAHAGRHADAARVTAGVRQQAPKNAFLLYNAACVYSVAAGGLTEKPAGELTPEERKLADGYGEAALECLAGALAAGFADHDLIRTDPELAAVRKLPGFAEVAKGLRPSVTDR